MTTKCFVCLETCKVPVQMTCFPCFRDNEVHCNSFARMCLHCVCAFFQLNKVGFRCLYCLKEPVEKDHAIPIFRVDMDAIINDPSRSVSCPLCPYVAYSHQDLYIHLFHDCVLDNPPCSYCGVPVAKKDVRFHMLHVHDMLFCSSCQKYIEHDQPHQCPRRIVKCRHCPECMEAEGIIEHLLVHLQESKQRCELLKDILDKEKKMSQQILRQCSQYFTEIYNDTL